LYAVPTAGGIPIELAGSFPALQFLEDIAISPNNLQVVYTLDNRSVSPYNEVIWRVPLVGGTPLAISGTGISPYGKSITLKISPDSTKVIYKLDTMFSTLNLTTMDADDEVLVWYDIGDFAVTSDYVIFMQETSYLHDAIYSIPFSGGTPTTLNGTIVEEGSVVDFKVSPNGEFVVYRADEVEDEQIELFVVPVVGGTRTRLLSSMVDLGDVVDYQILPNSQGVVYSADQLVDERIDLGAVAMTGGTNYWLNGSMAADRDVSAFAVTPNSLGVVFIADKNTIGIDELFIVSVIGTDLHRLNSDLPVLGDVMSFRIMPNNAGVVYNADQQSNDVFNLYLVPTVGTAVPLRLNGQHVVGGDVTDFEITSDSQGVIYRADQVTDEVFELFSVFDREAVFLPALMK